jgi:hypothetical protein
MRIMTRQQRKARAERRNRSATIASLRPARRGQWCNGTGKAHEGLREPPAMRQRKAMPRRDDDNVVPFRRKPKKWTRPQDFGHDPRKKPKRPKKPGSGDHALAAWAAIAALVALTVAWHFWR